MNAPGFLPCSPCQVATPNCALGPDCVPYQGLYVTDSTPPHSFGSPTGVYDVSGNYTLGVAAAATQGCSSLIAGMNYFWTKGANDTKCGSLTKSNNGTIPSGATKLVLTGTPNATVTAKLQPCYLQVPHFCRTLTAGPFADADNVASWVNKFDMDAHGVPWGMGVSASSPTSWGISFGNWLGPMFASQYISDGTNYDYALRIDYVFGANEPYCIYDSQKEPATARTCLSQYTQNTYVYFKVGGWGVEEGLLYIGSAVASSPCAGSSTPCNQGTQPYETPP